MRRSSRSIRGFWVAEGLILAAAGIVAGCSFDANELTGYSAIDSSTVIDGFSRGIDGQNGILDGTSGASSRDSSVGIDGMFDSARDLPTSALDSPSDSPMPTTSDAAVEGPRDASISDLKIDGALTGH